MFVIVGLVGLGATFGGLLIDAIMHARDPGLAAREGPLTLTNPGHLLVALGLGVVLIAFIGALSERLALSRQGNIAVWSVGLVAALGVAGGAIWTTNIGDGHLHGAFFAEDDVSSAAAATVDRSRLPPAEAVALATLSWSRPSPVDPSAHDHDHQLGDVVEPDELAADEQERLDREWAVAVAVAERLATPEDAAGEGYVQVSPWIPGVGEHWIRWSLVDSPFDPAEPSMLLFDDVGPGAAAVLVGFAYWVAEDGEPDGFAGPNDRWHQHYGLCFENGWLVEENIEERAECAGDWVNGSDLWMLHAWVAPLLPNPDGRFADLHPDLCRRPAQTPDLLSCEAGLR